MPACLASPASLHGRRRFLRRAVAAALAGCGASAREPPLRFAHRQANMVQAAGPEVFDLARRIPGLSGVELQVHFHGQTLWDQDTLLGYRGAAERSGLRIPSLAGIWPAGGSLLETASAEDSIRRAIRAAQALGAGVVLAAAFGDNCPKMDVEASYGPVVAMLRKVAPAAGEAGVTLGMETSLSPADQEKLVDLVGRPGVRIYCDLYNTETGYPGQAVPGVSLLGKRRICQVHLKNGTRLLEQSGPVDWVAAVRALRQVGYRGWYVFETTHTGPEQCIDATTRNIEFVKRHAA